MLTPTFRAAGESPNFMSYIINSEIRVKKCLNTCHYNIKISNVLRYPSKPICH